MASNGGTLHGGPQANTGHHNCSNCGVYFDSSTSLQVHMHYHHSNDVGQQQRWSGTNTTTTTSGSTTPTDSDNNNQPATKHHIKSNSPQSNSTIAAAADSSDNQPSTPQPVSTVSTSESSQVFTTSNNNSSGTSPSSFQQANQQPQQTMSEMHPYPATIPAYGYDQYYHTHNMDYGATLPPPPLPQHHQLHLGTQAQQQPQEYKTVPSSRYHPYSNQINKNGLSPKVVSSSGSPMDNNVFDQTSSASVSPQNNMQVPPGQPTPSPSPKQCDKCGMVCETPGQLSEHCARAHPDRSGDESAVDIQQTGSYPSFSNSYAKDEAPSDILDLDSQKMVYPQHPPIHPLHGMPGINRHPVVWPHEMHHHSFLPPQTGYPTIKPEYPPTPPQQQPSVHIKSEYNTMPHIQATTQLNSKAFGQPNPEQIASGDTPIATSPQDFPSTTTPQDNNSFRQFEPPTSSLSSSKGTAWKSNEARRPKTYNCTACNKWFTSSGHLKRHYNTTLHKNAVKSSGAPDPALTPISHHHHPNRDPNYIPKSRRNIVASQQMQQSGVQNPDAPRSPEYTPQFQLPSFGTNQGFQQYGASLHSTAGGPPNGVAGPSVLASQPRGLLIYSNNMATQQMQIQQMQLDQNQMDQEEQIVTTIITNSPHTTTQDLRDNNIINTTEHYNTHINHSTINTNIQSYQVTQSEAQNYHHIIGNQHENQYKMTQNDNNMSDNTAEQQVYTMDGKLEQPTYTIIQLQPSNQIEMGGKPVAAYTQVSNISNSLHQGDTVPPFSPDVPCDVYMYNQTEMVSPDPSEDRTTPYQVAPTPPAPSSPSITSSSHYIPTTNIQHTNNTYNTSHINQSASINNINSTHNNNNVQIVAQINDTKKQIYKCEICDKVFNKVCYLTQHNKTFHSGDKPYKCSRCGKRFPCEESSEEHFAKHAGDKPFKCEMCPKQFNHKTDLRRHMCVHTGNKPYCCEECNKGFIRKDHMIKHRETHRKREAMMAKRNNKIKNKQIKLLQLYDTNTSGSDISNSSGSCKNEQFLITI